MNLSLRNAVGSLWREWSDPEVKFPEVNNLRKAADERGWTYHEPYPETVQICPGARALGEDFLRWVDQGSHLLKVHRDARRGPHYPRHWASMLHSTTRYRMDSVIRCAIPDATILAHGGGVLSAQREWIRDAYFISNPLRKSQIPAEWPRPRKGRFVSLHTIWGDKNMGHYFFDAMLRMPLFENPADYQFIVPATLHPWHRGLYEVAGIKPEQLVPIENPFLRVEELNICRISNSGSKPRRELLLKFRENALKHVWKNSTPSRTDRRLFVDRSGAKRRKTTNQDELLPVLRDRGFEMVRWEDYSIADQIRLASEANVIVGPHGTSLLNSVYCSPGAKLLEIFNPLWCDATTLRQCCLAGHEFWYCFGENVSRDYDTAIAPEKLARVLDYMLESGGVDPAPEEFPEK